MYLARQPVTPFFLEESANIQHSRKVFASITRRSDGVILVIGNLMGGCVNGILQGYNNDRFFDFCSCIPL